MEIDIYDALHRPTALQKDEIANFLYEHLQEYGDKKEDILKAMEYALKERISFGGFILAGHEANNLKAAVVVNQTGMDGYIPANILVYIAVHKAERGKGLGKKIMQKTIEKCSGGIALHVEPENPARWLYEKLGFTNKYLEMRLAQ